MRNHRTGLGVVVALALIVSAGGATAQSNPPWLSPAKSEKLLDELKALVDKGESQGLANRSYIAELRQLTARYDWPWSRLLLIEEFADGNYTANPAWTVRSGRFETSREFGLVSIQNQPQQQPTSQQSQGSVGQQLLGAVLQQVLTPQSQQQQQQQQQQQPATRGDIYTPLRITNGFDIRVVIRTRNEPGRFEFGPYVAGQSDEGYRIVYAPGGNPSLALVRYSAIGSGVVETAKSQVTLSAGQDQYVQWFRHPNGDMAVYVNGKETIVASDRTFAKGFDGFIMTNLGGTYTVGEIAIYGTN